MALDSPFFRSSTARARASFTKISMYLPTAAFASFGSHRYQLQATLKSVGRSHIAGVDIVEDLQRGEAPARLNDQRTRLFQQVLFVGRSIAGGRDRNGIDIEGINTGSVLPTTHALPALSTATARACPKFPPMYFT